METKTSKASPDGRRVASIVSENGKEFIVLDGEPQARYEHWIDRNSLTFSPDSRQLAYVVRHSEGEFVVVDGIQQGKYGWPDVHTLVFSPDSRRFAYVVRAESDFSRKNKYFVVVDGRRAKRYDSITPPVFAPNSRFLAYVAANEGTMTRTHFGDVRLLTHFYLVIHRRRPGVFGFLIGSGREFPIAEVGWLFPEFSADGKMVKAVDRNNGETRLTVNLDAEL